MKNDFNLSSLLKLAAGKSPDELLNSLPADKAAQVQEILKNKELTNKILNSKEAQDFIKKMKK